MKGTLGNLKLKQVIELDWSEQQKDEEVRGNQKGELVVGNKHKREMSVLGEGKQD